MSAKAKTPLTVIGGYLGSGKTTLVNHLLRNAEGKRLAILVNEFGELQIDADLIEAQEDDVISLAGGCVCCSYGNDLIMAMMDMAIMDPPPDHIILEASGVALPAAIAGSLSLLNDFAVDGIVVLADAETIRKRFNDKYMGDTVARQLSDADIVLLNKTDLVSVEECEAVHSWLSETTGQAPIIETHRCTVPAAVLLQDFDRPATNAAPQLAHQTGSFQTELLIPDNPVEPSDYAQQLLQEIPGLIRAKGFVNASDGSLKTIQLVGNRIEITPAPTGVVAGVVTISVVKA
ncbi:MAG: CobW family GTP-binding protein [Rhizobiaceae bacterium]